MLKAGLFILPVLIIYGIRKYIESKWSNCKNKIKLDGKLIIITGANSGIGFEVAKDLAARNANIILACRNINAAEEAIQNIKEKVSHAGTLIPMELDLASLESVKNFAEKFKRNHKELHVLINNAGVSYPKSERKVTKDCLEIHFGVNHLGHFYLTNLLLDLLEKSKPSKVVFVSSKLHEKGKLNTEDLNSEWSMEKVNLYSNSKLANAYTVKELALRTKNKGIDVFAVCPGWIYTNLFRHSIKWYHYILVSPIAFFFMRSAKQGAQTIIYCATEPGLESGMIYRDCKMYESSHPFDPKVSTELWSKSEEIIKQKI
ncbi:hypothetical protein WA026_016318 [Henosepilachna vigintioctopunctata]|uniref:Uncharacterized protein n=1 Tax=Henosepilachna vigintioctopunctata TaxID=420089 RepID=A0AAW1UN52_9CUCU